MSLLQNSFCIYLISVPDGNSKINHTADGSLRGTEFRFDAEPNSHEFNPKTLTLINNEVWKVSKIISFTELQHIPRRTTHEY